jgi:poly(A) polymerase
MHKDPKDYDIATNAKPADVMTLFPGSRAVGEAFAVVLARIDDIFFEVASFRKDHAYKDGRRPESISFADPETDAARRDFTMNALFYDPIKNVIHDYVNGQADIAGQTVRCVGEPDQRFAEDHLRMLRAVRFACSLDFAIEQKTAEAIRQNAPAIARISPERVQVELTRILLESRKAGDAVLLIDDLSLLNVVLPEVTAMKGQSQPPEFHPEGDVLQHTVIMLNMMQHANVQLAYSLLLHDIGKPGSVTYTGERIRFDGHANQGADLAREILQRLRFSSSNVDAISYCVGNHMRFMDVRKMRRSTLRRLVSAPTFPTELELHRLDCLASHGDLANYDFLVSFRNELVDEPVLPDPWITGHDVMKLGIPEGPQIGHWHKKAFEMQLEDTFKTRDELLEWLKTELSSQKSDVINTEGGPQQLQP